MRELEPDVVGAELCIMVDARGSRRRTRFVGYIESTLWFDSALSATFAG